MSPDSVKKAHFIGIGGIGVSAIARMFLAEGAAVSGSDATSSRITDELATAGATIHIGHAPEQVPQDADLVVYTIAVPASNPELAHARQLDLPLCSYPEILGAISKDKYTIAVSGTHGKTTTTGMLASIFLTAQKDPTVVIGSILTQAGSNVIAGTGEYFIAEACEYKRSFLNLMPQILAITNIEADHLDYYHDLADIQMAFRELVGNVPADGVVVCDAESEAIRPVLEGCACRVSDWKEALADVPTLQVPGAHNRENAAAAFAAARAAGIDDAGIRHGLSSFAGTWRRLEYRGETANGALVYDDYAHHSTEIRATLAAVREQYPDKHIHAIFQPHLFSRTRQLFDDFATSFADADAVFLAPIYAAREPHDPSISSEMLAAAMNTTGVAATAYPDFESIVAELSRTGDADTVIVTLGAGDIFKVADLLRSNASS